MLWANVLHIYQPPTQDPDIIHRIVKESYGPLVDGLAKTPNARITLNISASLTDWLDQLGYFGVIRGFEQAAKRGQIEFLASAKYHPILPLIPSSEAKRQILLNTETNRKYFGPIYNPSGFFLPEMAYSREVGELVAGMGYKYLIMDQIGYDTRVKSKDQRPKTQIKDQRELIRHPEFISGSTSSNSLNKEMLKPSFVQNYGRAQRVQHDSSLRFDRLYTLKGYPDFSIFFRNRKASDILSFGKKKTAEGLLQGMLNETNSGDRYLITAVDGETFGHHRKKFDHLLFAMYQMLRYLDVQPVLLGDLLGDIRVRGIRETRRIRAEEVDPLACSWSSQPAELARGIPFALWDNPGNPVHKWQWKLARLALQEMSKASLSSRISQREVRDISQPKVGLHDIPPPIKSVFGMTSSARELLDRALHSDQFWWASGFKMKEIKKVFWNRELIKKGAMLAFESIAAIPDIDKETLARARDYYLAIGESAETFEKSVVMKR